MLVFEEGGKLEYPAKNPGAKTRINSKLNPHMTPGPRFEPGPHWWEHCIILAPLGAISLVHEYNCIKFYSPCNI